MKHGRELWSRSNLSLRYIAITTLGAIVMLSFVPLSRRGPFIVSGSTLHFASYFLLVLSSLLAVAWAPGRQRAVRWNRAFTLAFLFLLLGVAIEVAQHLVPYRNGTLSDAVANILGVITGGLSWCAILVVRRLWKGQEPKTADVAVFEQQLN